MARDDKKKSAQSEGTEKLPQIQQGVQGNETNPDAPKFTLEQRHSLGRVYQLILSWRRERKTNTVPVESKQVALPSPERMLPTEREA